MAFFHSEGGVAEFGHHHFLGEIAEVGILFLGIFLSQFVEVVAFFDFGNDVVGGGFAVNQNVACSHFLLRFKLFFVLVVEVFDVVVGNFLLDFLFQINFSGQIAFHCFQLLFVFGGRLDAGFFGGLLQSFAVSPDGDGLGIKLVESNLCFDLRGGFISLFDFGNGDFLAVDDGGNSVFAFGAGRQRI